MLFLLYMLLYTFCNFIVNKLFFHRIAQYNILFLFMQVSEISPVIPKKRVRFCMVHTKNNNWK